MSQPTPVGPLKVLGHVSLIVALPMVGGPVAGMLIDGIARTSPLFVMSGLAVGSFVAILGVWLYVRVQRRKFS